MATTNQAMAAGGRATVNVFDGTRQPYSDKARLLITASDGNHQVRSRKFYADSSVPLEGLPLFDNLGDNYTFLASADGYKDTGYFPVKLGPNANPVVDLMLLPKSNELNFSKATWTALGRS